MRRKRGKGDEFAYALLTLIMVFCACCNCGG